MRTKFYSLFFRKKIVASLIIICLATGCVSDRFDHIDAELALSSQKNNDLSKNLKAQYVNLTEAYNNLQKQNELLSKQLLKSEKAIRDIEKLRVAIPVELENRIKAAYDESILNSEKKIRQENSEMVSGVKKDLEKALHALKSDISLLARQKIKGNEEEAKSSYLLAKKSLEKKDYYGARVYCLNAINHCPTNFEFFKLLLSTVTENDASSVADYEQIRNVFELGLYQIDSEHIPEMAKLIEDLASRINGLTSEIAKEQAQKEQKQTKQTLNMVQYGRLSWDNVSTSPDVQIAAQDRLEALNSLLSSDSIAHEEQKWCKNEINRVNSLMTALISLSTIDNSLAKAQRILDKSIANGNVMNSEALATVNSMVQTANNVLGQSWNINFNLLPDKYLAQMKARAEKIASIEVNFNRIKSEPAIVEIYKLLEEIRQKISEKDSTYTERLNIAQAKMQDIMSHMANVYDKDAHQRIEKSIMNISDELKKLSGNRYKAYQEWAVGKCREAFEMYKRWTRVDEVDAISVITKHLLEIDAALLTPDVAKLYQDVLSKQFAEMHWKKIAEQEEKLATHPKKALEDF